MGLFDMFDKREKMDMDKASGVMFTLAITYPGQGQIAKSKLGIDENHMLAVNAGYLLGMSMLFIAPQIGMANVDRFIELAMRNAKEVLLADLVPLIPEMKKYTEKASNYMLKEALNINQSSLFSEMAKRYLNDLFEGKDFPGEALPVATQDMMFFYNNIDKFVSGIKITK